MTTQDSVQIEHLFPNRQMTHSPHEVAQTGHATLKPRLLRTQAHLEIALLVARTVEGKAQKVNRL